MYGGTNPSALQSQRMLADAMVRLMASHSFSEITVTMLCSKANVSRQTFYKMFDDKEDVVRYVAKGKCLDFERSMVAFDEFSLDQLATCTFAFFEGNIHLVRRLIDNQLHHLLQEQAQQALAVLLTCYRCDGDAVLDESNRAFIAGGLCSMLVSWVREGNALPVEERARRFSQLFAIGAFRRIGSAEESTELIARSSREA